MRRRERSVWAVASIVASIFFFCRCGGGLKSDGDGRARLMLLTSGPTEIVLSSAKVPGYWAKQLSDEQEFFLSTEVRSYEKGRQVRVEGPLGFAHVSVFHDETGIYLDAYRQPQPTTIIVVWKISELMVRKDGQPPSGKSDR